MPKTNYGPPQIGPANRTIVEMKTTEYLKVFGEGKTITPGSILTYFHVDTADYRNAINITLNFSRWDAKSMYLDLRDAITLDKGMTAKDAVRMFRKLADRLEKNCVDKVEGKEKP